MARPWRYPRGVGKVGQVQRGKPAVRPDALTGMLTWIMSWPQSGLRGQDVKLYQLFN